MQQFEIEVATPLSGITRFKFKTGREMSEWVWKNKTSWFSEIPKNEQRD